MLFDSSPSSMIKLSRSLKLNETVIRHTMLNLGSKLSAVSPYINPNTLKGLGTLSIGK